MVSKWDMVEEPAACPRCGGESVATRFVNQPDIRPRPHSCERCQAALSAKRAEFAREYDRRFPSSDVRLRNTLSRHYTDRGGVSALLRATDAELLGITMMGPKAVAQFRAMWPTPQDGPPEIARALPCLYPHGSLSWVGG